ncbi:MAG: CD225/dispanin family protein [Brachymonas sp.]
MDSQQVSAPVPNYLVGSILVTLFCCLPTGIASIVFASRANSKAAAGDLPSALEDAKKAKFWLWFSVIASVAVWVIYLFFVFGLVLLGAAGN